MWYTECMWYMDFMWYKEVICQNVSVIILVSYETALLDGYCSLTVLCIHEHTDL